MVNSSQLFEAAKSSASGAAFSPDRVWRYALWRSMLGGVGSMVVIGLNPSTADERQNDPTIRRCMRYAKDWGYANLFVLNLFAFCATAPADLKRASDPVGPRNDEWLRQISADAQLTLVAWGNNGRWRQRDSMVKRLLARPKCLGITKEGAPLHPLYVPADRIPSEYSWPQRGLG
jgi:hypothetical protein